MPLATKTPLHRITIIKGKILAFVYWLRAAHHTNVLEEGYVGYTSKTVDGRFKEHIKAAKSKTQKKHIVHKAIIKYEDNLIVTTLIEGSEEYCLLMEERLRPTDFIGWNQVKGGNKPPSCLGKKQSPEHAKKAAATRKANLEKETEEQRVARLASYARWSEESKRKFSEQCKGKKKSAEHIANMRKCQLGKKQSEETKQKKRIAMIGKPIAPSWATSTANKVVWSQAITAYSYFTATPGISPNKVEPLMGFAKQQLGRVFAKFRNGWNPSEDTLYLAWLAEYNQKQKELA